MRILQVDVNFDDSSTGKIVKDLQEGLEKQGHQVECCYGRDTKKSPSRAIKISSNAEVYVHAALSRVTGFTGVFSPIATINLINQIERFRPDVVHLHELHGYYININQLIGYLKNKGIPVLWTFHCEFMYTGKCGHAYECDRWMMDCGKCPQLGEYPKSIYFDQTSRMLQWKKDVFNEFDKLKIAAPSKWLAQRIGRSFLKNKYITTVYNGIDTAIFKPRDSAGLKVKHDIKTSHILVSVAPNLLSERKGGRWILELARKMEDDDVTFIMIGVEDASVVNIPNVICLPRIDNKVLLSEYYALADFSLLTSKKETFSLVCAESLACGTPIIGFESGAPSEVAPPGYGVFVNYGDIDSLCNEVKSALTNRSAFKTSDQCALFAKENFGKDVMINAYLSEYVGLINGLKNYEKISGL